MTTLPRYPIYVPSKGRFDKKGLTARFLIEDGVPFKLVVEPTERAQYADAFGEDRLLVLPFADLGQGSIPARNWIFEHAKASGAERHWVLDDNMYYIARFYRGRRLRCASGVAFAAVEDFTDRYENVDISGMNYWFFGGIVGQPAFFTNVHVYSCMLLSTVMPYRWRGRYNEDTDLCLQVLTGGTCTVLVNVFLAKKVPTMTMTGGNTDELYQSDGRLKMSRSLERVWPGLVTTKRKFKRPQHHVKDQWGAFTTPLRLKPTVDLSAFKKVDEYGLELQQAKAEIKDEGLRDLLADWRATHGDGEA